MARRYAPGLADEGPARKRPTTLLQALTSRRDLAREETIKRLEARSRATADGQFALTLRHLDRLLRGKVVTPSEACNPTRP